MHASVWLIAIPFTLAALLQLWAPRSQVGKRIVTVLTVLPVPATAIVLLVVIAAVVPELGPGFGAALRVAPIYLTFAMVAPLVGWSVARVARLDASAAAQSPLALGPEIHS